MTSSFTQLLETIKSDKKEMLRIVTLPAILLGFFLLTYSYSFQSVFSLSEESLSTYILSEQIADGNAFENNNDIAVTPLEQVSVGYPYFVAFFMKAFGFSSTGIKVVNGLLFLGMLLVLYRLGNQITKTPLLALVACLYVLFNFEILQGSFVISREILLMFLSITTFSLLINEDFSKQFFKNLQWWIVLCFCVTIVYVQIAGIALLLAVATMVAVQRKWGYLLSLIVAGILFLTPLFVSVYEPSNQISETFSFSQVFFFELPATVFNAIESEFTGNINVILLAGLFLSLAGLFYAFVILKKKAILFAVFMVLYIVFVMVFSVDFNQIPSLEVLVPLLVFFTCFALTDILTKYFQKSEKDKKLVKYVPLFLLAYMPVHAGQIETFKELNDYSVPYSNMMKIGEWVNENVEDDAVIACASDKLFHITSERKVLSLNTVDSLPALLPFLIENKVNYLVVDFTNKATANNITYPAFKMYNKKFEIVMEVEHGSSFIAKFDPTKGYFGEYNGNLREGKGTMKYPNGDLYQGQWLAGEKSGKGIFMWTKDKVQYRGEWLNNQMHGIGQMRFDDGVVFVGVWDNGVPKSMSEVIVPGKGTLSTTKEVLSYFDKYFNE